MNKTICEESPDLVSFFRVVHQHRAEGGRSSPGDGNTNAVEIDTVVDVDDDLDNGEHEDEERRRPPPEKNLKKIIFFLFSTNLYSSA